MRKLTKCDTRTRRPQFFCPRVHVTFRKREHLWLVSLHCVCAGKLPDWGESLRWRQAFWLWHSVQSCHLLLDSTSAVPPSFPGLVRSTRLVACFSPWALLTLPNTLMLSGWQEPSLPFRFHSPRIGWIPYECTLGSSLLTPLLILFQGEYTSLWLLVGYHAHCGTGY